MSVKFRFGAITLLIFNKSLLKLVPLLFLEGVLDEFSLTGPSQTLENIKTRGRVYRLAGKGVSAKFIKAYRQNRHK